jgi:DNA-binding FrmR family transcriptional regulator
MWLLVMGGGGVAYSDTLSFGNDWQLLVAFDAPGLWEVAGMRQCMDSENLHRRMNKIIGQLNAINRMMDEDVPCEDILMQINAAKAALHKVGQVVLEGHLSHCVRDGIEHGNPDRTIEDFARAVEHFSRMS